MQILQEHIYAHAVVLTLGPVRKLMLQIRGFRADRNEFIIGYIAPGFYVLQIKRKKRTHLIVFDMD